MPKHYTVFLDFGQVPPGLSSHLPSEQYEQYGQWTPHGPSITEITNGESVLPTNRKAHIFHKLSTVPVYTFDSSFATLIPRQSDVCFQPTKGTPMPLGMEECFTLASQQAGRCPTRMICTDKNLPSPDDALQTSPLALPQWEKSENRASPPAGCQPQKRDDTTPAAITHKGP